LISLAGSVAKKLEGTKAIAFVTLQREREKEKNFGLRRRPT
jgi:hypothetical protein